MIPGNLQEFSCIVSRMIARGDFDAAADHKLLNLALVQICDKIKAGPEEHGHIEFSASEVMVAQLFIRGIEQAPNFNLQHTK